MGFEEVEHTADRALRVRGKDLAQLLENAARAMSTLDETEPEGKRSNLREIEINGCDRETLLVNWLNEVLFLEQTCDETYHRFHILEVTNEHLRACVEGCHSKNRVSHLKAATFHQLEIKQTSEGLEATIVFDV